MSESYITPGHVNAFQAVRSQLYDNIILTSCKINGESGGVAIVMLDYVGERKVAVMPLFVAVHESMDIEFVDELIRGRWKGGKSGGPKRSTRQEFTATKDVMSGLKPA